MDNKFKIWKQQLNDLDSETVFRQNGAVFSPDGKSFLNPCRNDKRFGSCHFYNGKAWDMAGSGCGKGNVIPNIDAVMALSGLAFLDACDLIARQNGLPTYNELKGYKDERKFDTMPLNDKQIKFLHLQRYGSVNIIKHCSTFKPQDVEAKFIDGLDNEYYWGDSITYTLDDLYREDSEHEGFWALIESKVREWYPFYTDMYKRAVWESNSDISEFRKAVLNDPEVGLIDAVNSMTGSLDTFQKFELLKFLSEHKEDFIVDNLDNQYTNPFAGIYGFKDYFESAIRELSLLAEKFGIKEKVRKKRKFRLAV